MNVTIFFYINTNAFVDGRANSVYDLSTYNNLLYIADYHNDKIIVVDIETKKHIRNITVPMPHGLVLDKDGNLYVASHKKNAVYFFNNSVGIKEIRHERLDYPVSVAVDDDRVYVANWSQSQKGGLVAADKKRLSFETFGNYPKKCQPHAIKILFDGRICSVNRNPASVVFYNKEGSVISEYTLGENFDPLSLTEVGECYIIPNYSDGKLYVFDNDFNVRRNFSVGDCYPMSTAFYNNFLFVSEEDGNRIHGMEISVSDLCCMMSGG